MMNFIINLFLLIFGHSLADSALQSSTMGKAKRPSNVLENKDWAPWWMWMTHHSLIHGGVVAILTKNGWLGIIEFISHWIIDFLKSTGKYNTYVDQVLHIGMKIIYCLIIKESLI